jgi:hypothetical protein
MSLATLASSKVSVIEADAVTVIQFATLEAALSALVKHQWVVVSGLDRFTVLFQNVSDDTLQLIMQLKMSARLEEKIGSRRALTRLSLEASHEKAKS